MHCVRMQLALAFSLLLLSNAGAELGVDWVKVENTPRFSPRRYHTAVVHQDKIWVIAGLSNGVRKNDVWNSPDGINWTQVTEAAPFTPRFGHQSVVYQDKIWVIGGDDGAEPFKSEVWCTTDGVNSTNVNGGPAFFERCHFAMTVHDDKMWIIGGGVSSRARAQ